MLWLGYAGAQDPTCCNVQIAAFVLCSKCMYVSLCYRGSLGLCEISAGLSLSLSLSLPLLFSLSLPLFSSCSVCVDRAHWQNAGGILIRAYLHGDNGVKFKLVLLSSPLSLSPVPFPPSLLYLSSFFSIPLPPSSLPPHSWFFEIPSLQMALLGK